MAQTISAFDLLAPIFYSGLFVTLFLMIAGSIIKLFATVIEWLKGM